MEQAPLSPSARWHSPGWPAWRERWPTASPWCPHLPPGCSGGVVRQDHGSAGCDVTHPCLAPAGDSGASWCPAALPVPLAQGEDAVARACVPVGGSRGPPPAPVPGKRSPSRLARVGTSLWGGGDISRALLEEGRGGAAASAAISGRARPPVGAGGTQSEPEGNRVPTSTEPPHLAGGSTILSLPAPPVAPTHPSPLPHPWGGRCQPPHGGWPPLGCHRGHHVSPHHRLAQRADATGLRGDTGGWGGGTPADPPRCSMEFLHCTGRGRPPEPPPKIPGVPGCLFLLPRGTPPPPRGRAGAKAPGDTVAAGKGSAAPAVPSLDDFGQSGEKS